LGCWVLGVGLLGVGLLGLIAPKNLPLIDPNSLTANSLTAQQPIIH
jgi:hypothetical protein